MPDERRQDYINAHEIAEQAVKRTFAILGVNVDNPSEVEDFRKSLRFSDTLRKAADRGFIVFVSSLVAAALGALWLGIKGNLTH